MTAANRCGAHRRSLDDLRRRPARSLAERGSRILKLLSCNGRILEVREVGPVVYRLEAAAHPIKLHGDFVL